MSIPKFFWNSDIDSLNLFLAFALNKNKSKSENKEKAIIADTTRKRISRKSGIVDVNKFFWINIPFAMYKSVFNWETYLKYQFTKVEKH